MTAKEPCRPQLLHEQHVKAMRCYAAPEQHGTQILSSPSPDDEVIIDAFGILTTFFFALTLAVPLWVAAWLLPLMRCSRFVKSFKDVSVFRKRSSIFTRTWVIWLWSISWVGRPLEREP
mmetsp:Transcript_18701/g.43973  ORF Transcript_18701/g.43973 Transcript_18701/m.43973 type:complete len:119 (+) Transcript_18701:7-363(+)